MEAFTQQLVNLSTDQQVSQYFLSNNINVYSFIKTYIAVDKVIKTELCSTPDTLIESLSQIKQTLAQHSMQLTTLTTNFNDTLQQFTATLKDVTNNDIRTLLLEYTTNIQSHLNNNANATILTNLLQNFQDKLINVNTEKLNDFDRKSLEMFSNIQSNILKDISTTLDSHTIHHKVTSINDTLTALHNNFTGNSSQKGKMSENMLFHNLLKAFPDSDVVLTRDQKESCDIQIKRDGRPAILIDSKHCEYSNVRKSDLDKFYDDCKLNDSCGILCNAFGGIANKKHFEIDIQEKRVYVFVSNHEFDPVVFQLAARVIYNVYDSIKEQRTDVIQIDQQLYQRLKIEYNFFLQSFQQHLDNIKANVNSLSQLCFTQIDQFFKRSNYNSELKPFACNLCGTGCSSAKALNKHLRDKHAITHPSTGKRGRPRKEVDDGSLDDTLEELRGEENEATAEVSVEVAV